MAEPLREALYDGAAGDALARALSLPRVVVLEETPSTMDVANELAASGAPAGTLVLANAQAAGRGRGGKRWESLPGAGIWATLIERLNDRDALDVLSLRIGLGAAAVLDRFTQESIRLKWPNDLYLPNGKLGGILVESRWRGDRPEWTAIGIGINVTATSWPGASALGAGVSRVEVLGELVPALRAAAAARGHLETKELADFAARDVAFGRACLEPCEGRAAGVAPDGALLVETSQGLKRVLNGSLVMAEDAT